MIQKRNTGRGGSRKGSGKKKSRPTKVVAIRHDKTVIDTVRNKYDSHQLQVKGQEWLDELAND